MAEGGASSAFGSAGRAGRLPAVVRLVRLQRRRRPAANDVAAQALINTQVAAAGAMLAWLVMERFTDGHATVLGAVAGAVAGLATITPCAGYVDTYAAIVIGGLAGLICHRALPLKRVLRIDDALDVIPVHFIGGILGTLLLGFFADKNVNPISANGVFYGGGGHLLGEQAVAIVAVVAFSFGVTWIIAAAVARTIGLRVPPTDENDLDWTQEALSAYALGQPEGGLQPLDHDRVQPGMALADGELKLVSALVEYKDLDELRTAVVEAGAVQIVLSEASLYTSAPRTEVFRGQRRKVAFDPRLRLEVTVKKSDVQRVVQAIQQIPGISTYPQVIDAGLAPAVGDSGGHGAVEQGQGDPSVPAGEPTSPRSRSTASGD